jgi:O-succinylbenzoic acid--CoA ligase
MQIENWLERAAGRAPRVVAVETPAGSLSYAELRERAETAAGRLARQGVEPGDRVALALPGGLDFAVLLHATWRLGAVAVPIDPRLGASERAVQSAGAALTLEAPLEGDAATLGPRRAHDNRHVAAVIHTSGSTGAPKPVELTFGNFHWNAAGSALALGLDRAERWLCPLPVCHVGGLSILVRSAIYATTAVVHDRFEADRVAGALAGAGITLVSLVATTLSRTLDAGLDRPGALRCAVIGGGPVPGDLLERARARAIPLAQTYGLTEACSMVTVSAIGAPETAGRAIAPARVQVDPVRGEIEVGGATVALGAAGEGGLLRTGDLGSLDADGRLTVTGRSSERIVSGGENVSPTEVEAALESHPAVAEAAVFGRPHAEWGEAVSALVVLAPGARVHVADLRRHARARLAGFKVPKEIAFAERLPRTPAGKLRRSQLPHG